MEKLEDSTAFLEIVRNTGKENGAFYTADPLWREPVLSWIS